MSREPLTTIVGTAAPLLRANVDTDLIIRIDRMGDPDPTTLARFAFEALRLQPDGSENPSFILNDDRFRGSPILVGGPNFGCGSSREPAVSAIYGLGIRCVIAPSFGDIFRANCHQQGVLPIVLGPLEHEALAAEAGNATLFTVDLPCQRITGGGSAWTFEIGTMQKIALIEGLDDLALSMREIDHIREWEAADRTRRPWAWTPITTAPVPVIDPSA